MRKMMLCNLCILFAALFSLEAPAQEIENKAGVRHIHNPEGGIHGRNLPIAIELLRTIGDIETDDENFAFHFPSDIAQDAAGNIYILDSGNHRIQKFSPAGKYLNSFGRRGQGPGDFLSLDSLDLDSEGNLWVADSSNQRIQSLTPEGRVHKTIRFTAEAPNWIRRLSSGEFVTRGTGGYGITGDEPEELPHLIRLIDEQGTVSRKFGEMHDYRHRQLNWRGNVFNFTVDGSDFIYLAFSHQNRIEKYSPDGRLIWRADRHLDYTTEPLDKGKIERTATSQSFYAPRMNTCSGGISVDSRGRVWVLTYARQIKEEERVTQIMQGTSQGVTRRVEGNTDLQTTDMYKLEVFAPDGVLLGEIPLTHFADGMRIQKDNLFLLDKLRGVKFFQYRITEE